MKLRTTTRLFAAAVAGLAFSLPAAAAPDEAAAQKLAKDSGCTKCHTVDKSKKGPSYQKIAAKYKGKGDAVTVVTNQITKAPKVKFADGSEDTHDVVESKDPAAIKNLVDFILAQ